MPRDNYDDYGTYDEEADDRERKLSDQMYRHLRKAIECALELRPDYSTYEQVEGTLWHLWQKDYADQYPQPECPPDHHVTEGLKSVIKERDKYACVLCGSQHMLCVRHIVAPRDGGETEPDNLCTLCRDCNDKQGGQSLKDYTLPPALKGYSPTPVPHARSRRERVRG